MKMKNKICLVTGATDGIGYETAKALAFEGGEVLVHGRSTEKGAAAVRRLIDETGNQHIRFFHADFSSLDQVRKMAAAVNAEIDHLDVLVNNAGLAATVDYSVSADGYELTFAVNHLAPFLLTGLLLDKIIQAPAARVVNVSSVAHKMKPFDIDDLMSKKIKPIYAYGRSKFANILFSHELARRLSATKATSNALHPGTIRSNFGKEATITRVFYRLAGPFLKTPVQGAQTSIYLAMSDDVQGQSGGYYADCKPAQASDATDDRALAERLWRESERLVGL